MDLSVLRNKSLLSRCQPLIAHITFLIVDELARWSLSGEEYIITKAVRSDGHNDPCCITGNDMRNLIIAIIIIMNILIKMSSILGIKMKVLETLLVIKIMTKITITWNFIIDQKYDKANNCNATYITMRVILLISVISESRKCNDEKDCTAMWRLMM